MADIDKDRKDIEANIKDLRKVQDLSVALRRLEANKDFKRVITEGYFRDEAIRLVHLKADPSMQTPEKQAAIVRDIDAIGVLNMFFHVIERNADHATKAIAQSEFELEEMAREEQGGDE